MTEQYNKPETPLTAEQVLQAGAELLDHFGVEVQATEQPDAFRNAIKQLNPRYKEDRTLVRWELEADQTEWPQKTQDVVMRAADGMNMLKEQTPLVGAFDVAIVLGAARQAPLDRMNYAAKAVIDKKAKVGRLIIAGGARELKPEEQANVANYAPHAILESDLCVRAAVVAMQANFGLIVQPRSIGDARANTASVTADVLGGLSRHGLLPADAKVAAITTQIYTAATQLDVERAAQEFGVAEVFTVGNPSSPEAIRKRTLATYLSEVNRTLTAASRHFDARA